MRILLTNDDGIDAPGLAILREIAAELSDDVWVSAPDSNKSGAGHSLSLNEPLRMQQTGERSFATRGTPDHFFAQFAFVSPARKSTLHRFVCGFESEQLQTGGRCRRCRWCGENLSVNRRSLDSR